MILLVSLPLLALSQQYPPQQRANEVNNDVVPAWYQTPQKQLPNGYGFGRNPPAMYERAPSTMNYQSYPTFGTNRPAYPELMGSAQPARRYPMGGQDRAQHQTSLARYHQLLLRKQEELEKEKESKASTMIEKFLPKSLKNIYSTIVPYLQMTTAPPIKTSESSFRGRITFKWITKRPKSMVRNTRTTTSSPRNVESTTNWETSCCKTSTLDTVISTSSKPFSFLEYFWPNAELLAAIKDVVAKFKASLDETGLDQDVRLMGNQLRNTWQQLRTGPMNEQLGRLFDKAADDGNQAQLNGAQ
ncbi:hypothetical protein V3C99_014342 [Haemonchus contortus]